MLSIGETAAKLGVAVSALRYWDERGLVRPATRRSGKRLYGEAELHRLAIVKMLQDTGLLSLDDIALILHGPEVGDWRAAIRVRIEEIVEQRRKLAVAETFLGHFARCPRDHPVETCPSLRAYTDRVLTEER
ncbi:MerR family transcriptional regulator [Amycolatopsis rhabdoformis]|uniref:MerR family transcriptional regulator n=1 Tax=Amycolatopsis rhabdoformis TaxID=1448059 RepID=A0ABZ1I2K3_9PSEU|nr:MerR family transcriptional regulator [Amycolatopsis rhabdoformis]WSE28016.1 MerR family transcriptional regulator [Amycolatopsis rhabdoformis]